MKQFTAQETANALNVPVIARDTYADVVYTPEIEDNEEACRECGDPLDDGEGWDGLCGNCADALENEEDGPDDEWGQSNWLPPMQELINSGQAWQLEGSVGRQCMDCIESGDCLLGEVGHRDYWGNYIPSRHEVEPGTKGSLEYAERMQSQR